MNRALLPDLPGLDTFGAPKTNFAESIKPDSEASAEDLNALAATAVALAFAGPRCWVSVSSGGALIIYGSVWGDAPGLAPVCARTSAGLYTVTFDVAYPDLFDGTLRAFAPKAPSATANASARGASAYLSGQVVTVETYARVGGTAVDAAFTVEVR